MPSCGCSWSELSGSPPNCCFGFQEVIPCFVSRLKSSFLIFPFLTLLYVWVCACLNKRIWMSKHYCEESGVSPGRVLRLESGCGVVKWTEWH